MPQPDNVSDELYQLMLQCWQLDLDERPDFQQLEEALIAFTQDPTVSPLPVCLSSGNKQAGFILSHFHISGIRLFPFGT